MNSGDKLKNSAVYEHMLYKVYAEYAPLHTLIFINFLLLIGLCISLLCGK